MCGRYTLSRRQQEVAERFGVQQVLIDFEPRYNVAPTQQVSVVLNVDGVRSLVSMKWGLVPFWVKDPKKTRPFINARAETIAEKPSFKNNLARRRCLIPADGFYEWRKEGKAKIPMHIHRSDQALFAFAGLWDEWRTEADTLLQTCTIITTQANDVVSPVHDRMPVILPPDAEPVWLDPERKNAAELLPLLAPFPDHLISMYEVSQRVNSAMQDDAEMMVAIGA